MEYSLHIEGGYTPADIPMERLAEYLAALAKLLGERQCVHFTAVKSGSVAIHASVDIPAQAIVAERIRSVRGIAAPKDAIRAFETIDDLLRQDNATGSLRDRSNSVVIPFPGREKKLPPSFGPIRQACSLTGQLVRIGGKDSTIPVHLRDGDTVLTGLIADEDMARQLAAHYLGQTLRVHGIGTWLRDPYGCWKLERFKITGFDVLNDTPLADVVARLRAVRGSTWGDFPDPVAELLAERKTDGGQH